MFSIGLTLLSAGLLEDFSYLYNTNDYRIDMSTLREKMEKFRSFSKYSEILRGTIINLCDLAPGKRLSGQELWEFLYPHSESIRMRESFIINNAPMKVNLPPLRSARLFPTWWTISLLSMKPYPFNTALMLSTAPTQTSWLQELLIWTTIPPPLKLIPYPWPMWGTRWGRVGAGARCTSPRTQWEIPFLTLTHRWAWWKTPTIATKATTAATTATTATTTATITTTITTTAGWGAGADHQEDTLRDRVDGFIWRE